MIVIPMAGLSQRFAHAGYSQPKYMLPLGGRSVFSHAVASFAHYAEHIPFLFIARALEGTEAFIRAESAALNLRDVRVILLDTPTAGQAETVAHGLERSRASTAQPITIFNIDTFRPGFRFPGAPWSTRSDGFLEVFEGDGANWSYVGPSLDTTEPRVERTTEKQPISNLCCTGLYHFARAADFLKALSREREAPSAAELYVAPLYNHLIADDLSIHYDTISRSEVIFCGTPDEYAGLRSDEARR